MTASIDTPGRTDTAESAQASDRDRKGRFAPGNRGKPLGSRNKATAAAEALLQGDLQKLTRKAVELALAGDTQALRLCIERLLPARKPTGETVNLPELASASTPSDKAAAILNAIASGRLATDTGRALVDSIASVMKISEIDDLARRIEALEQVAPKGKRS